MVCACSSTTAINRFHMIWVWICASAAFGRATMKETSNLAAGQRNIAELVDLRFEQGADHGGGVVLGNHRWSGDRCARCEITAPIDRHVLKFASLRIEQRTRRAPRMRSAVRPQTPWSYLRARPLPDGRWRTASRRRGK